MKISESTPVTEALSHSPNIKDVFIKYGLTCFECYGSTQDTIKHVINNNGLDKENFLNDLNASLE
jgi:hybrid cluster-associated redox disulfide protein